MEVGTTPRAHTRTGGFFDVVTRRQSYANLAYLLLSLPLGAVYFAFVMAGLALGFGTLVIGIGVFVLLALFTAARALGNVELSLADWLLGTTVNTRILRRVAWNRPLQTLGSFLRDPATWKDLGFLSLKFPLGIVSFVCAVTLGALTISLLVTPLAVQYVQVNFLSWPVTSIEAALTLFALGLLVGILSLHLFNAMASLWRSLTVGLLGSATTGGETARRGPIIIE